jgi:hypothetical protein
MLTARPPNRLAASEAHGEQHEAVAGHGELALRFTLEVDVVAALEMR